MKFSVRVPSQILSDLQKSINSRWCTSSPTHDHNTNTFHQMAAKEQGKVLGDDEKQISHTKLHPIKQSPPPLHKHQKPRRSTRFRPANKMTENGGSSSNKTSTGTAPSHTQPGLQPQQCENGKNSRYQLPPTADRFKRWGKGDRIRSRKTRADETKQQTQCRVQAGDQVRTLGMR